LRGRDQEDLGLKPAKANSLLDHISKKKKKKERKKERKKNLSQKRAGGVAQGVNHESS
jgi:hypothetical protein